MNGLVYQKDKLTDVTGNQQVMMVWEKPYMEALVENLNPCGDVLEIGFGMGYSADAIQTHDINSHTIIECDINVLKKLSEWAKKQKHKVNIIEGTWQEKLPTLTQRFDSFFLDDYPDRFLDPQDIRCFDFYYQIIQKNVNKGARFTWFCTEYTITWPCSMFMKWDSKEYDISAPDSITRDGYLSPEILLQDKKVYMPLVTFKKDSPMFIHPIVIEKFKEIK